MNFYPLGPDPHWVYVGTTKAVVRFPYRTGDLQARSPAERIMDLPDNGHNNRDVLFEPDGQKMLVTVPSFSNADDADGPLEKNRAKILECNPDGSDVKIYAYGIRNPSFMASDPKTNNLWITVNERDGLGDNLVPDYITHVQRGGFYGWPWWYMGGHQDPRLAGMHPSSKIRSLHRTCSYSPTMPPLDLLSTMANSSRRSFQAIFSPLSTAHGTRAFAPATKSSAYPYINAVRQQENMRTS